MNSVETAVNGFGRIGMLYSRVAIDDPELAVRIINVGGDLDAHDAAVRLEHDSTHRDFNGHTVENGEDFLSIEEERIALCSFRNLHDAPWEGIAEKLVVVESTGAFLTKQAVQGHFDAGAKRVVITAPARDTVTPTIVRGVNDTPEHLKSIEDVVAVSSCSTNCIAPIVKVLSDTFDVRWGVADIPHAYTNSQRPLDSRGNDTASRRGLNSLLPASTGSAKEVIRLFPGLDFFRAESMRVPIEDGSVAMLTIGIMGTVALEQVTDALTAASQTTHQGIIGISRRGMYSERILGQSFSAVIDLRKITVDTSSGMSMLKLQGWFDNEWGYANRVAEVTKLVGQAI